MARRLSILRDWLDHLERVGVDIDAAGMAEVDGWLETRPCGSRARYCHISHLHMFYVWAQRAGIATHDPTALVERPRLDRRLPRPARQAAVDLALLDAKPLERIMLVLMADAGLRCCEVATLEWRDVDLAAGTMFVHGKGGRDRLVGMPTRLVQTLAAADHTSGPVTGRRLSPTRISQLANRHLKASGVDATAHQLRHMYATRLYAKSKGDLLAVQQALGHASVTSTQIYAYIDAGRAVEIARTLDDE